MSSEYVEIQRMPTESGLTMQKWRFWFDVRTATLWLDAYEVYERPSKRHAFRRTAFYSRLDSRDATIELEDVPLPDNIRRSALNEYQARIKVAKWEGR